MNTAPDNGALPDGETSTLPSFWGTLARAGTEPRTIRHPQQFEGGEHLSIACTQTDLPATAQKALVAQWCAVLPSLRGVRVLWLQSKVPQALFDAACQLPGLQSLYLKWNGLQQLDALGQCPTLRHLHLGASGGIVSVAPLQTLPALAWFQIANAHKIGRLDDLAGLQQLEGLAFTGGDSQPATVPSLAPLAGLQRLRWLQLGALRVGDGSLRPLGSLAGLQWLGLPNHFEQAEFAWLSTRLTQTRCDWLAPFARFHRSVFPCPVCRRAGRDFCRVMTSGRGSKLLCPHCDAAALARQVAAFEHAVLTAHAGPA
ncbi:MAG: leucine-rich repeat domain-containing protein [Rubrivivax sp.]|nr:leucine-rich repeat domain-containing protein [Rubrivivax sp.]